MALQVGENASERGNAEQDDLKPVTVVEADEEVSTDEADDAEYVDEGKYTTVTVEPMDASREGLRRLEDDQKDTDPDGADHVGDDNQSNVEKGRSRQGRVKPHSKEHGVTRKKRRNFRYENKAERKLARVKTKVKNMKQAKARKGE